MKSAFAVVLATMAALAAAAPLNINLGAYSPALVISTKIPHNNNTWLVDMEPVYNRLLLMSYTQRWVF
ncbi:hypothetical protein F5Y15DRAFT_417256 [Xylariaceae sp. FL0016]|nr:hypothetical protein F5Y15DRAFT_417256 [Xylariaceae sp. FL0016]